jgi:hypothetical protein
LTGKWCAWTKSLAGDGYFDKCLIILGGGPDVDGIEAVTANCTS